MTTKWYDRFVKVSIQRIGYISILCKADAYG